MEDYKEIVKELILKYFNPFSGKTEEYKSTLEILEMVQGVIPNQPFCQHDIFELMKELSFEIEIVSVDERKYFLWKLYNL